MLAACFMLVFCLAYSSTLKMKATYSSKSSFDFQQTTWHFIPEDGTFQCFEMPTFVSMFTSAVVSGLLCVLREEFALAWFMLQL
jgi:hypothetical protein